MFLNESAKKTAELLSDVESIYISDKFFEMISEQSCDCDEIVIKNGEKYILLTLRTTGDAGYIVINEISDFEEMRFPYEVDISGERFKFDKLCLLENGAIDGIRFRADGVFLFVSALQDNLVLTKSKYDIFEEIEMDIPESEESLRINRR